MRIITFTAGVAGPFGARVLTQCGAEVIKVESLNGGLDSFRYFSADDDIEASARYVEANLNVLSAQLNVKGPTGTRLLLELAAKSDVVLDNVGLVNNVVPAGELMAVAEEMARNIMGRAPISLRYIKEAVRKGLDMPLEQGLALETDLSSLISTSEDTQEGARAFVEKRPPNWQGR